MIFTGICKRIPARKDLENFNLFRDTQAWINPKITMNFFIQKRCRKNLCKIKKTSKNFNSDIFEVFQLKKVFDQSYSSALDITEQWAKKILHSILSED
jgi:hypothetical protein